MKNKFVSFVALLAVAMLVLTGLPAGVDGDSDYNLVVSAEHGIVVDNSTGNEFTSGNVSEDITLVFIANYGYEFVRWDIIGLCDSQTEGATISISDIQGKVRITPEVRNYSTSHELINVIDVEGTPLPGDTLVNTWNFNSTLLVREGDSWDGMPSTPLIVGDRVYVRAGGVLYSLDIHSGTIVDHVNSPGNVSFYHYISYGNGVIFDHIANRAYDLELNILYDIPSNLSFSTYHDGYFYGLLSVDGGYRMFKTSLDVDKDLNNGIKANLFTSNQVFMAWSQYGQHASIVFEGDYMFFVEADGKTGPVGYRAITAFNLRTEEYDTKVLEGFTGLPWDDGWLSYYNGYFYLTAYVAGLFDGAVVNNKNSSIMWVKFDFDKGKFETPSYKDISTTTGAKFLGIASGLEIHDGRGYVNVRQLDNSTLGGSDDTGSCLIAYNIGDNGEPIPQSHAGSVMTHGGIVVNTAYADDGKKYIYVIPYNMGSQGLYVFTDEYVNGEWTLQSKYTYMSLNTTMSEYSSQAIRAGPNGEIIYYPDHGYLQCFVANKNFQIAVTVMGENYVSIDTGYGMNAGKVLESMYPGSEIGGNTITIAGKNYTIYGLNQVYYSAKVLSDVYRDKYVGDRNLGNTEAYYTHIYLVEEGVTPVFNHTGTTGWYFFNGKEFEKCDFRIAESIDAAAGKTLIYSDSKPESSSVFIDPFVQIPRGSSIEMDLPQGLETSYIVTGGDAVTVSKDGNVLTITAVKEDNVTLSVTIDGIVYDVEILVMPKVTVVGDDTVTESVTSKPTESGGRVDSITVTTSNDRGYSQTNESCVYDGQDSVIEIREINKTVQNAGVGELIVSDQYVYVEEIETKVRTTEGETPTTHTQYRKEIMTKGQQDGTVRTETVEAMLDAITGRLVTTTTIVITNSQFSNTTVTVSTSDNGTATGSSTEQTLESIDGNVTVSKDGNDITVNVSGDTDVDITDMVGILGTIGSDISVITGTGLSGNVVDSAASIGATVSMSSDLGTMVLGPNTLNYLKNKGDMLFSLSIADVSKMTPKQKEVAGDAVVFDINLWCGDVGQHDFGPFSMRIVCDIAPQQDKALKVWRIDEYGQKTYVSDVSYADGVLSFVSDHLSYYAVGYESVTDESNDDGAPWALIGIGAAVAAALIAFVAILWMRRR